MQENEEKFRNSSMNQNFVFPRKYIIKAEESWKTNNIVNNTGTTSSKCHRRYKSLENKYLNSIIYHENTSKLPNKKKYNILQQTLNISGIANYSTIKYKINHNIIKKNLKKFNIQGKRPELIENKSNNLSISDKTNYVPLSIGNTYDNRRIANLNSDSFNWFSIAETASPKDSLTLKHWKELKRKTNKTPINRYIKTHNVSAIGLTSLYRNQAAINYSGRESLNGSSKKFMEQKTFDQLESIGTANTQLPTPRLYWIPSNNSLISYKIRNNHR